MTIYEALMNLAKEWRADSKGLTGDGRLVNDACIVELEALAKRVCADASDRLREKLAVLNNKGGFVDFGDIIGGPKE